MGIRLMIVPMIMQIRLAKIPFLQPAKLETSNANKRNPHKTRSRKETPIPAHQIESALLDERSPRDRRLITTARTPMLASIITRIESSQKGSWP